MTEFNHNPNHFERNNRVTWHGFTGTVDSFNDIPGYPTMVIKPDYSDKNLHWAPSGVSLIYDQPSPINPDDLMHNSEFCNLVDDSEVVNGLTVYQLEDGRTVTVEYDGSLTVNDDINYDPTAERQPLKLGSTMIQIETDAPEFSSLPLLKRFEEGDRVRLSGLKSSMLGTVKGWQESYASNRGPQTPMVVVQFDGYPYETHCHPSEITLAAMPTAEEKAEADAAFAYFEEISKVSKREYAIEEITDAFEMLNQVIADFYQDLVQNEDAYGLPMNKVQNLLAEARTEFESLADGD